MLISGRLISLSVDRLFFRAELMSGGAAYCRKEEKFDKDCRCRGFGGKSEYER